MLKIFNSLSKKVEEFTPIKEGEVGMYACGPTVYDFPHIGHGRKYVNDDILRRVLKNIENLNVTHVQNITDVGHLVSDADEGEDKLEKGALKFGKTVWEVAEEYTNYFLKEMDALNIIRPTIQCKATEHIPDQIELIKKIITNGYAYDTPEAVYFEVSKFPEYSQLFGQSVEEKLVGVREGVVTDNNKRHPADFALWFKRVGKHSEHVMHWESPWGDGFPGWHIECSAMSMKYLGEQIDLHTGGEDHLSIHHPNEITQSEAATGKKPFVKYWFHSLFLTVDGKKMSKSLGNVYKLADVIERGFSPMALRYLYLSTHYRKTMNFTWESLEGAQNAYLKLQKELYILEKGEDDNLNIFLGNSGLSNKARSYSVMFVGVLEDDLNTSAALAVLWDVVRSKELDNHEKRILILNFDRVLGLGLDKSQDIGDGFRVKPGMTSKEIDKMIDVREKYRSEKNWVEADKIRDKLIAMGVEVKDK